MQRYLRDDKELEKSSKWTLDTLSIKDFAHDCISSGAGPQKLMSAVEIRKSGHIYRALPTGLSAEDSD